MDEILKKLLDSELLSEENKAEISSLWNANVETYKTSVREEVTLAVRAELSEQWVKERDALIESIESFVSEKLEKEIVEVKADAENYRNLEAEYAGKLVEEKQKMAERLAAELDDLKEKLHTFLEVRLGEEMTELSADLKVVRENDFGRRMFEAMVEEYNKNFADEDSVQGQLSVSETKLEDANKRIARLEAEKNAIIREQKMSKLLGNLSGKAKEQMAFVLQNVSTERLDETYKHFIGRVLKEEAPKPTPTPASDATPPATQPAPAAPVKLNEGNVVVTGEGPAAEPAPAAPAPNKELARALRLAGVGA